MKMLYKNIAHSLCFLKNVTLGLAILSILNGQSFASSKQIGIVTKIQGHAFQTVDERVFRLNVGDKIYDFSEIMTEVGAYVGLRDFQDHEFHLSGGGHISWKNKIIELKRGYLWAQSYSNQSMFSLQTVNLSTDFNHGEGILSFDPSKGKSQLLVVSGNWPVYNPTLEYNLPVYIKSSEFTLVSKDYNGGIPRNPTMIGENTYNKIAGLFNSVRPMSRGSVPFEPTKKRSRAIASESSNKWFEKDSSNIGETKENTNLQNVPVSSYKENIDTVSDEGFIIIRKDNNVVRGPSSFSHESFLNKKIKKIKSEKRKKNPIEYKKKSNITVNVFSINKKEEISIKKPASNFKEADKEEVQNFREIKNLYIKEGLEKSNESKKKGLSRSPSSKSRKAENSKFLNEYKNQMRHKSEVNDLINDLKSFKMDYKEEY